MSADSLVFCIQEHELCDSNLVNVLRNRTTIDTTIYILYDNELKTYVVRGCRGVNDKKKLVPYSFYCDHERDLLDFLDVTLERANRYTYILYNYDNLPASSDDITFDFLHKYVDRYYEITGFDNQEISRKSLHKFLRIIRKVSN